MVRDLNENASGTLMPWRLSDCSDSGEAIIVGAPGSIRKPRRNDAANAQSVVCEVPLIDPDDSDEFMRVQLDARRIVAAVNVTQNIPLETLERLAEFPSPDGVLTLEDIQEATTNHDPASREAAYYFPDED